MILTEWQKGQLFEKFCMKALGILGKSRIHLIIGKFLFLLKLHFIFSLNLSLQCLAMKPFVPTENLEWFKRFVKNNTQSVSVQKNVYWSSESSLNSNGSDTESILS